MHRTCTNHTVQGVAEGPARRPPLWPAWLSSTHTFLSKLHNKGKHNGIWSKISLWGRETTQLCFDLSSLCRPRGENRPKNPGIRSFTPSRRVPVQSSSTQSGLGKTVLLEALEWGCFGDKSCVDLLAVTIRTTHPVSPSKTSAHSFHPAEKTRQESVSHRNME